jgi:uncharacterized pyridoxamine 5'-phosphate oxidase family protein
MELDYGTLEREVFNSLEEGRIMVVATSYDNKVTARSMSCLIYNKRIYFQTSKAFSKFEQMYHNPNVAMCVNNMQLEGMIHMKGHPMEEAEFAEKYKEQYLGSYNAYSHMKEAVVIEVEPTFVTLWKYGDGQAFRDFLDIGKKRAYREIYDTSI